MKSRRKDPNEPAGSPYDLAVADDVDGSRLKSAFQTAAFSGWAMALLDLGGSSIALHARLPPPPPGAPNTMVDLYWPEEALVLVVRRDTVELLRANSSPQVGSPTETPPAGPDAGASPRKDEAAKSFGSVAAKDVVNGLPALLRSVCEQGPACSPAVLYVADDAPFSLVRGALRALTAISPAKGRPVVQLRVNDPEAPGTPMRVRIGATNLSGRLAPTVIQRTIRESFDTLRKCYQAGLTRDPNLTGKITTRFVIGRDGRVSQATTTDGTTMPDLQVTECVLSHLRGLRFPAPDGGIVTVVYPILFAPE
jgi:hypothetical protein